MQTQDDEQGVARIRELLTDVVQRLTDAGSRDEALARFEPERRRLFGTRNAVMVPLARVWRLGVFLLGHDRTLYEAGSITRALEPGRRAYQSQSAEIRRGYRAAAARGPFERGEAINYDSPVIELSVENLRRSRGPLFLADGRAMVRWNGSANDNDAIELGGYLDDRVDLLVHPPEGS